MGLKQKPPRDQTPPRKGGTSNTQINHTEGAHALDTLQALQIEKLGYELGLGRKLEVLKGFLSIVTAMGVVFTIYLGVSSQKQSAAYRSDDRLDRTIARLSSHEPSERLAGLAGMEQFLQGDDSDKQRSALIYLVNAATIENDAAIRGAIENTFEALSKHPVASSVLNPALELARNDNISLLRRREDSFMKEQIGLTKRASSPQYSEVPIGDQADPGNLPLQSTGRIIASLVRAGAKIGDLKGIYCVECNFSGDKIDQSGVSFEGALLRRADFSRVKLDSASFHNADLVLANFTRSSLRGVDLSSDSTFVPYTIVAATAVGDMYASYGTIFACADLENAKLSGRLLFTLIYDDPIWGGNERDEFFAANVRGVDFTGVQVGVAVPVSKFSGDPLKDRLPDSLSPLLPEALSIQTDALHYFNNDPYRIWTGPWTMGRNLTPWEHYRTDLIFSLGSLRSALGWQQAKLPSPFLSMMVGHENELGKAPISYDCNTGQKKVDISTMFDGTRMTGSARF